MDQLGRRKYEVAHHAMKLIQNRSRSPDRYVDRPASHAERRRLMQVATVPVCSKVPLRKIRSTVSPVTIHANVQQHPSRVGVPGLGGGRR
jgi:hypothetical protein